jgi:spore maturation protein A
MLNYIWGGLIIFSLLFALVNDGNDIIQNTWKNGEAIQIEASFPVNADFKRNQDIRFIIAGDTVRYEARWHPVDNEAEIIIPVTAGLPEHWRNVASNQESSRKQEIRAYVNTYQILTEPNVNGSSDELITGATMVMEVVLPEVSFVKLRAITSAAFDMAEFGVTLALGLIGIMALWLGLMKIAEESGLIYLVVRGVRPVMGWLFPELPKDHPAMGMISLNLAANILGLGNAATPLGIKAMEELQKLNPDKDSATNSMCMFLALNTSSVQLLPPVTLVAIMGLRVNELMVAITITTIFSTIAAIAVAKWYARRNPPPIIAETLENNSHQTEAK